MSAQHVRSDRSPEKKDAGVEVRLVQDDASSPGSSDDGTQARGEKSHAPITAPKMWTPLALRRPVIFAFACVAIAVLTALEVLRAYSDKHDGLAAVRPSLHYLWAYSPVALLTILAACWNQVDYQTRRNAPFVRLATSKMPAQRNLLLDYLSPIDVLSLVTAISFKDFQVVLSISASLILRLLIVLSTGLFVLRYPAVTQDLEVLMHDQFDFDRTSPSNASLVKAVPDAFAPSLYNTSWSDGTNEHYASQSFSSTLSNGNNQTVAVRASVATADLVCEQAKWSYVNTSHPYIDTLYSANANLTFESDSYSIPSMLAVVGGSGATSNRIVHQGSNGQGIVGDTTLGYVGFVTDNMMSNATCLDKTSTTASPCWLFAFGFSSWYFIGTQPYGGPNPGITISLGPKTQQSLNPNVVGDPSTSPAAPSIPTSTKVSGSTITPRPSVMVGRRQVLIDGDGQQSNGQYIQLSNLTALLCVPKVTYGLADVAPLAGITSSASGVNVSGAVQEMAPPDASVDAWTLSTYVRDAIASNNLFRSIDRFTGFFGLCDIMSPWDDVNGFYDPVNLENAVRDVFRRTSAQVLKRSFTTAANDTATGTATTIGPRLVVDDLTLRLVDGFLVLFALCALGLCLLKSLANTPRDLSTIGATALLCADSEEFRRLCSGSGTSGLPRLKAWLHGYRFHTRQDNVEDERTFKIVPVLDSDTDGTVTDVPTKDVNWWRPMAFNKAMRPLSTLAPILLLAGLEVALRHSQANQGFAGVPESGYRKYLWLFFPTIVLMSVALMFGALDFATRAFQPYHTLSSQRRATMKDILETPFGLFAAISVVRSLTRRQWALMATSLAVCLAPFLSIVVSGLYQAQAVPLPTNGTINIHDTFQPTVYIDSRFSTVPQDSSALQAGIILHQGTTWPRFTYNNLVLPNMTLDIQSLEPQERFTSQVPAAEIISDCAIVPFDNPSATWKQNGSMLVASIDLGGNCTYDYGPNTVNATTQPTTRTLDYIRYLSAKDEGDIIDLTVQTKMQDLTCPSGPITYQNETTAFARATNGNITSLSMVVCNPRVDQVMTNVTFQGPDFAVDNITVLPPPDVTNNTVFTTFPLLFSGTGIATPDGSGSSGYVSAIAAGPEADLVDPSSPSALDPVRLGREVSRIMDIVVAQRFSGMYRQPLSDVTNTAFLPPTTKLQAALLDKTQYRVVQSEISTRILQVLLALLSACAAVAWSCTHSKKVLPKNPLSIAAVASLLADSAMVDEHHVPPGAIYLSDEELKREGVFRGYQFSIGWWKEADGRKRYGIDVGTPDGEDEALMEGEEMS